MSTKTKHILDILEAGTHPDAHLSMHQNVLIVDDVSFNLTFLETVLEQDGVHILKASSGEEAITTLQHNEVSLIIMDVMMPGLSGYQTASIIRSNEKTKYIPIIFVTAADRNDCSFEGYQSGAVDILYKPVAPEILRSKVNIFLELDKQRQLIKQQSEALKSALEQLQHYAQHDQLTGLFNRDQIYRILEKLIAGSARNRTVMALLFLDLDHFKHINDSLGHDVGDQLLKSVAKRICSVLRESDFVARLGGDEFAVILNNLESRNAAGLVAQKIIDQLVVPHVLTEHEILVSCSIGIAFYDENYENSSDMLKAADSAMYQAKRKGRSQYAFYSADLEEQAIRRLELARALNEAIDKNELSIYYQPQLNTKDGRIVGLEALMRWQLNGEWIGPYEFIPIAEESGLIPKLGEWMLVNSCKQIKAWQDAGVFAANVRVAVNISNRQLQAGNFLDILQRALTQSGITPKCLELELTESAVMHDPDNTISLFNEIHKMGIDIAVDDFGTGYSSLSYLRKLPIDTLKIDRSFVQDIDVDANDEAIVNAIIGLAHHLGLQVVAEGVETEKQRKHLLSQGCDILQGYLFSRPLPAEQVPALAQSLNPPTKN